MNSTQRRNLLLIIAVLGCLTFFNQPKNQKINQTNDLTFDSYSPSEPDQRDDFSESHAFAPSLNSQKVDIDAILNKMKKEDKCGQMNQVTFRAIQKDSMITSLDDDHIDEEKLRTAIETYRIGSIFNTLQGHAQRPATWQKILTKIHDFNKNFSRNKIPILYGIDSIHGANYISDATFFPQPLAMASSFNLDIAKRVAEITAMETRAVGIPWNFNPVLDVGRQPLWPRLFETYGEDTYVAAKMGGAYVKAHQGHDLRNRSYAATCLKHYIGYSFPTSGKDRTAALIPEIELREHFLPPFKAGVAAGSLTVMLNSGKFDVTVYEKDPGRNFRNFMQQLINFIQ
jgi:beta-glucosidase